MLMITFKAHFGLIPDYIINNSPLQAWKQPEILCQEFFGQG